MQEICIWYIIIFIYIKYIFILSYRNISSSELSFEQEHLFRVTDRILLPAAGAMLADRSVLDIIRSFGKVMPIGSILWGEGLLSGRHFSEFQLSNRQVLEDSSIGIYWKQGEPIEQLAINTKAGVRNEVQTGTLPLDVINFLASHFQLTPQLMAMAYDMGSSLIGEQPLGSMLDNIKMNMAGAGIQFALHRGVVKVLIEGFYGDKATMLNDLDNIRLKTQQVKRRLKLGELLQYIPNVQSGFELD